MVQKVILITGASSGIGFDAAMRLAEQGHTVYGGARRTERMEALKEYGVIPIRLDVTDESSVSDAISLILAKDKRIDVLINNAGYGFFGALEDVSLDDARAQFDVNVFGLASLTQKVLPIMRAQHGGTIINISSTAGRVVIHFGAWYHATKYAVEALSDALRMETKEFGIDVVLIEPGGIRTDWGSIAAEHLKESSKGGAYEKAAVKAAEGLKKHYSGKLLSDPKVVSKAIMKAVNRRRPRTRYLIGFGSKTLVFLHAVLPSRAYDRIMTRMFR